MALVLSGDGAIGPLSATEVGYLDGVTSGVQTQLNAGGLVTVIPTTIANSGGTATLTGKTITFSGCTSLSLNGIFTSDFDNYELIYSNASSAAGNVVVFLRLRAAGVDATGSDYFFQRLTAESTSATLSYAVTQTAFSGPQISNATEQNYITARFMQPQLARKTMIDTRGGYIGILENYYGGNILQSSFDGLTLFPSSSSITGTIRVYGYKNT